MSSFKDLTIQQFASIKSEKVYELLQTTPHGLTENEAENRLSQFGLNSIKEVSDVHPFIEFIRNFKNPLVLILIAISIISLIMGSVVDALIVLAMVVMSVTLNFYQEHKANLAARKLQNKVAASAVVLRPQGEKTVKSIRVVPGDVIILNAGDLIPADSRIVESKDLFINQSALTGESFPAEKHATQTDTKFELIELQSIVFAGTSVVSGTAKAVVIKTGQQTEFGKIAQKINKDEEQNEFTLGIAKFSNLILKIILVFVVVIFFFSLTLRKTDETDINRRLMQSLAFSIAVAVGLTPEFLPVIMTITMSRGSVDMAKKGVIVKRLTAIPTFGSMDILCTDKTGTLTEDKIRLIKCLDVDGCESEKVFLQAYLNSAYQTGITNPMDTAVMEKEHLDISNYKKIDEIPFDFERKKMSVVVESENEHLMITKGAPEEVLSSSSYYSDNGKKIKITERVKESVMEEYEKLSQEGFRVLAIANKKVFSKKQIYSKADEKEMTLIGYVAFLDPVKEGVKGAIDDLEKMGVEIKVVTGDNELVTKKICKEAGIEIKGILLGHEMDNLTGEGLLPKVKNTTIFARFSPSQKTRVIEILRKNNDVVGYMGDGINDAPSLKAADVGISVSNAVDVAKESADIILTNKSLHELKEGVIDGRKTFGNTLKYIMMGLSSNFGNMFSVLGAVLFLPFLPMLPIQILLNNFMYDFGQITIPSDKVDEEFIKKPKRWDISFIRKFMFIFGPISSLFDFITFAVLYMFFANLPAGFQTGWFMESLATQTLIIYVIRTRKLPFIQSSPSKLLLISTILVVCLGWLIPYTPMGNLFEFVNLPWHVVTILIGIVFLYLVTVEIGKRVFYSSIYANEA